MPYAAPSILDEDKLKEQQQGGVNISGESASFSTGVPGQESASSEKPAKGSGAKFANIQSYLEANKDQGNQMGQKIQSDVSQNADLATNQVNSLASKAPEVKAYDPSEAYKNVTTLSQEQKDAYNQNKAGYKGPQSLDQVEGFGDTQKQVSKAYSQVQNAGTEEGQRALLKETYKRPSYTAGENALDQTIVQNAPNSKKGFEDLTQKYSGLSSMFDQTAQNLGGKVNQAVSQGLKNQQAIAQGEQAQMSGLLDPIKERARLANVNNRSAIDRITSDASDETLSDETLAALGLGEGTDLYDLNLQSYLTPDMTEVGINNAANADERQRYAALTALINGTAGNEITADGKNITPVRFDSENFQKARDVAKGNYERQLQDYLNQAAFQDYQANQIAPDLNQLRRMYEDNANMGYSSERSEQRQLQAHINELQGKYDAFNRLRDQYLGQKSDLETKVGNRKVRKG